VMFCDLVDSTGNTRSEGWLACTLVAQ